MFKTNKHGTCFHQKGKQNKCEGALELLAMNFTSNLKCLVCKTRRCLTWTTVEYQAVWQDVKMGQCNARASSTTWKCNIGLAIKNHITSQFALVASPLPLPFMCLWMWICKTAPTQHQVLYSNDNHYGSVVGSLQGVEEWVEALLIWVRSQCIDLMRLHMWWLNHTHKKEAAAMQHEGRVVRRWWQRWTSWCLRTRRNLPWGKSPKLL